MMVPEAKEIGRHYASIVVLVGLVLAALLGGLVFGRSLLARQWADGLPYLPNLVVAVLVFYACGWLYGGWAGQLILLRHYNPWVVGALLGVLLLVTTAFFASWVGFFQEGLSSSQPFAATFYAYVVKPLLWVTSGGLVPALLAGLWFGYQLKSLTPAL